MRREFDGMYSVYKCVEIRFGTTVLNVQLSLLRTSYQQPKQTEVVTLVDHLSQWVLAERKYFMNYYY